MRLAKRRRKFGCEVNITPLIDIVFLLIIFSMVVSQFSKLQAEKLELPTAHKGRDPHPGAGRRLVVNVMPSGRFVVSGRQHSAESMARLLAVEAERQGAANVSVVIRSDRRAPWASAARILQACAAKRIARVKVAVTPQEKAAKPQ
jgi:biopolymer transport protein ExbD